MIDPMMSRKQVPMSVSKTQRSESVGGYGRGIGNNVKNVGNNSTSINKVAESMAAELDKGAGDRRAAYSSKRKTDKAKIAHAATKRIRQAQHPGADRSTQVKVSFDGLPGSMFKK